jgi:hypothetical protein
MSDRREQRGLTVRRRLVAQTFAGPAIVTTASGASSSASDETSVNAAPTVAVHLAFPAIRDQAPVVLVGTVLIGLGAAVRRAA